MRAIVLAAGKGKRMNSDIPKCLHKVFGKEMILWIIDALEEANIEDVTVVVGYKKEIMKLTLFGKVKFVEQEYQLGTADAVKCCKGIEGDVIILLGDMPFIKSKTIENMIRSHKGNSCGITIATVRSDSEMFKNFGRVVRENEITIVEAKDALDIVSNEYNASIYITNSLYLFDALEDVQNNNNQNEYYLTDILNYYNKHKLGINIYEIENEKEVIGINSQEELEIIEKLKRF